MEKWFQSIALIPRDHEGKNRWLARSQRHQPKVLNFISAPRLGTESFRETIRRETAWTLNLDPKKDLLVSSMAQLNLEFVATFPNEIHPSHIGVSFFMVQIYGKAALQQVEADSANRWLSSREVCEGPLPKGEKLDPRLSFLLKRAKVINAWD